MLLLSNRIIKKYPLYLSEISDKASCLANEPTKSLSSLFTINNSTGGLYFSADYQCKQIKGNDSYSCEVSIIFFFYLRYNYNNSSLILIYQID